jgi:zinc transporter, ZIP family
MGEAFLWGVVASSSLVIGGLIALRLPIPTRLLGLIMAFGAGVLISAVAYELVDEASETTAGEGGVALGLALGSLAFFVGNLGIVLDGVPESIVLGLTLLSGDGSPRGSSACGCS